ncbi:hypothetical protein TNCV_2292741 [Trichonephila clavipes]|nr:hypothetical protein TNCV_2292741 [Trichonephila clavipes]
MSNQTYRLIRYYLGKEPCEMLRFVKIRRHWEVLICVTGARFVALLMLAVVWESENERGLMGNLRHWFGDYRVHCNGSDGRRELLIISELEMEE